MLMKGCYIGLGLGLGLIAGCIIGNRLTSLCYQKKII